MRKVRIEMVGLRYGRLLCIGFSHRSRSGHAQWLFKCDCGQETVATGSSVRSGKTRSCGCLHREICAERLTIHGHRSARDYEPTYRAWQAMNDACTNPASPAYRRHGLRGITVCENWRQDFRAFLADMGERPDGTILKQIDPSRGFDPGNCHWLPRMDRSERALAGWASKRTQGAPQQDAVRR